MHFFYKNLIKPVFFKFDPENIHDRMLVLGKIFAKSPPMRVLLRLMFVRKSLLLEQTIAGIKFSNPVGLSAGFDKNADLVGVIPLIGFGFQQIGSVTWNAYEGNPKPRLYRLPKSKAIVVYYGLKNIGTKLVAERVVNFRKKSWLKDFPLSFSIAKTNSKNVVCDEDGVSDYVNSIKYLENLNSKLISEGKPPVANFYTINISCPNTYGGEPFTTPERFNLLAKAIVEVGVKIPIFIKMPINLPWDDFKPLLDIIIESDFVGVIIGNLNKNPEPSLLKDDIPEHVKGGISGLPTKQLSNELIAKTYKYAGEKIKIIGVGGIFNSKDAYEKIKLGASLVQLITGMIYEGPQLIRAINRDLAKYIQDDGFVNIAEAIGSARSG